MPPFRNEPYADYGLPENRAAVTLGITAGASTPDSVVGEVLERILALRGCTAADLVAQDGAAAGVQTI